MSDGKTNGLVLQQADAFRAEFSLIKFCCRRRQGYDLEWQLRHTQREQQPRWARVQGVYVGKLTFAVNWQLSDWHRT